MHIIIGSFYAIETLNKKLVKKYNKHFRKIWIKEKYNCRFER
jgi:hypothetical protein